MTTEVYYRKWRPQRLGDLVGQEPVVHTLKQAIIRKRIAHAYLLCGPRGTGKTSTARILAKAVNCLEPQEDGEPCNSCHLCVAVNEGRAIDLVEIDAASHRGIDEIRNIREKVNYAPAEATYKVYILDEAHMLTDAASDALLKTIEEPPSHIIFMLATTEPHRLSSTVISRCQRYDFRRITPEAAMERLAQICNGESIEAEQRALHLLARSADGSLRDAENLLEQAVTSFGSPLTLTQVRLLLGLTGDQNVRALATYILHGRVREAVLMLASIASDGLDLKQFHRQVVDELRDLLLIKSGARKMVTQPEEVIEEQSAVASQISFNQLLRTLRLLGQINTRNDVPITLQLELAVIESAQGGTSQIAMRQTPEETPLPTGTSSETLKDIDLIPSTKNIGIGEDMGKATSPARDVGQAGSMDVGTKGEILLQEPIPENVEKTNIYNVVPDKGNSIEMDSLDTVSQLEDHWDGIVKTLSRHKGRRFNLGALSRACQQRWMEEGTLTMGFTHRSHMERMEEEMDNPESRRTFLEVVTTALGLTTPLALAFTASNNGGRTLNTLQSPMVQAALSMGGRILQETEARNE